MFDGIFEITQGRTIFTQKDFIEYTMDWTTGESTAYLPDLFTWSQSFITPRGERLKLEDKLRLEAYRATAKNVAYVSERS